MRDLHYSASLSFFKYFELYVEADPWGLEFRPTGHISILECNKLPYYEIRNPFTIESHLF